MAHRFCHTLFTSSDLDIFKLESFAYRMMDPTGQQYASCAIAALFKSRHLGLYHVIRKYIPEV